LFVVGSLKSSERSVIFHSGRVYYLGFWQVKEETNFESLAKDQCGVLCSSIAQLRANGLAVGLGFYEVQGFFAGGI